VYKEGRTQNCNLWRRSFNLFSLSHRFL